MTLFSKNTMAGHQNRAEKDLGMHACMDAHLQAGPSKENRPVVQLLRGSAKDPLGEWRLPDCKEGAHEKAGQGPEVVLIHFVASV
jgi:hypothetical protein